MLNENVTAFNGSVCPPVGTTPIAVGAELSAPAPVVKNPMKGPGSATPLVLFTPIPTISVYFEFAANDPGTNESAPVVVENENDERAMPPLGPTSVILLEVSVVASIVVWLNLTKSFARFVGILMLPLNGVIPVTNGGVMFAWFCPAAPVVNVI